MAISVGISHLSYTIGKQNDNSRCWLSKTEKQRFLRASSSSFSIEHKVSNGCQPEKERAIFLFTQVITTYANRDGLALPALLTPHSKCDGTQQFERNRDKIVFSRSVLLCSIYSRDKISPIVGRSRFVWRHLMRYDFCYSVNYPWKKKELKRRKKRE